MPEPKKPFVLDGENPPLPERYADYPADMRGDLDSVEINARECERLSRQGLSGPLGNPYGPYPNGPQSQESYEEQVKREEEIRAVRGGLPDSSPEMPPQATSSKPFKF
jgi:hypothetical protein